MWIIHLIKPTHYLCATQKQTPSLNIPTCLSRIHPEPDDDGLCSLFVPVAWLSIYCHGDRRSDATRTSPADWSRFPTLSYFPNPPPRPRLPQCRSSSATKPGRVSPILSGTLFLAAVATPSLCTLCWCSSSLVAAALACWTCAAPFLTWAKPNAIRGFVIIRVSAQPTP